MLANRSIPHCTVIPELAYPDVDQAADWLCDVFGFTLRLRIANHRVQLNVGDGAMVVTELRGGVLDQAHSVLVRVENVDAHYERAKQRGARLLREPEDYPYGERQYSVEDFAGHRWKFYQTIADVSRQKNGAAPAASSRLSASYELPINHPVRKTNTPPTIT